MADAISIQELIDARTDAKTLEEAVNGDAVTTVLSRLGESYPTLANALSQIDGKLDSADTQIKQGITNLFENGGLPATPFKTKALMTASALVDGDYAMVTDDTVNNGLYVKTAGAWVKSSYDPLTQAKTYADTNKADTLLRVQNVFATKALMTESALVDGSNAQVNNDTTADNNGFYKKTAGAWVKSYYDPVAQSKTYTDTKASETLSASNAAIDYAWSTKWFIYKSMRINENGEVVSANQTHSSVTDYIPLDGVESVEFRGLNISSLYNLYAFYADDKTPLLVELGSNNVLTTIARDSFPEGAKYIRVSGDSRRATDFVRVTNLPLINSLLLDVEQRVSSLEDPERPSLLHRTHDWFVFPSMYVSQSGAVVDVTVPVHMDKRVTDFLPVKNAEKIVFRGYDNGVFRPLGFYDAGKNPLGPLASSVPGQYDNVIVTIDASDFPEGTRFVRVTGRSRPTDFVNVVDLVSANAEFNDLYDAVNSEIVGLDQTGVVRSVMLCGASLAYSGNGWFETARKILGITGYNRAVSAGGYPDRDANALWHGNLFTDEVFEQIDVFAFQYANVLDIDSEVGLFPTADEYTENFDPEITSVTQFRLAYTNAQCFDYTLKKLQEMCYAQKDNPLSKWYGTPHGKPLRLLFITHWHDARVNYNNAIRNLAERWGASVCEFDKKIGFSKNQPLPDGTQVSTLYAEDNSEIEGVIYGHHPKRGEGGRYIQRRMADIFTQSVKQDFGHN